MTAGVDLAAVKARAEAATEGPWRWAGNTDTGEPRLTGRGCDVLAIGWDERSTTGRDAEAVRQFAADNDLDPDEEIEAWATDRYGEPIREPRLWFYTDHMADPARENVVFEVAPSATTREDPAVYRADITSVRHPDAEFIAHARTDVPALVAEVERLRALVTDVRDTVEEARQASMRGEVWVVSELGFNVLAAIDGASS